MATTALGTIESKDRLEAYLRLSELSARLFEGRRQYEWKVTLTFWVLIVAATKYLKNETLPPFLYFLVPAVFGFVWLRGVYVANENDKRMMYSYRHSVHKLLLDPSYALGEPEDKISPSTFEWWLGFLLSWGTFFEFATSVLLVCIAYKFIG